MTTEKIAALILAAGKGTRMKSDLAKVLHPIAGLPMVSHVVSTVGGLQPTATVVVIGPEMEAVEAAVAPLPTVVQETQAGTADALLSPGPATRRRAFPDPPR